MPKLVSKKQILFIGGILVFILWIITSDSKNSKDNQTMVENQQNQASLVQNVQNEPISKENIESEDSASEPEQNEQPTEKIEDVKEEESFFRVTKVIDGDTIRLENGEAVRYIGIDTPETVHPSKPVQCFAKEASDKNKELVEGKLVRLEKDVTDRDKYGRLLRYVWIGDMLVNDYLVREGYAYVYTYPPDVKYNEQFLQAQKEARENNRGLRSACKETEEEEDKADCRAEYLDEYQCSGSQLMRMHQKEDCNTEWKLFKSCEYGCENGACTAKQTPPQKDIICSYDAYNCSDFSTHAEAQNAFEHCGGIGNDVHRLDADKDGSACESLP